MNRKLTVVQMLPALESGGVERGTLEIGNYLVQHGHRSIVISAGGRMAKQLLDEGIEHIDWPVGKKSLLTLRYIYHVRRLLLELKPDILHLRSRLPAWIGYLAWKSLPKDKRPHLVTTVHGPYTVGRYSSVMTKGECVIAVSEMIKDYILSNYPDVDPARVKVIHRGVDPDIYKYGYRADASWCNQWFSDFPQIRDKRLLTLPARLTRWKGQDDFIEVVTALVKSGQAVHGIIVGGSHPRKKEYENELQQRINELGMQDNITMVGHRSDLKEILSISDIVYSLAHEPEAFGRTTIEALSMGIPVIGYAHGGVKEQLAEVCFEGLILVGDIGKAINLSHQWISSTPDLKRSHPFTLEKMCAKTVEIYNELLKQEGPN